MHDSFTISGLSVYAEEGILKEAVVEISHGVIKAIHTNKQTLSHTTNHLEFPSSYTLLPGFIDLHVHGANGSDVMDGNRAALTTISKALAAEGVTGFLATTMTASPLQIEQALGAIKEFMQTQSSGAAILGVHLEGPFISIEKAGAQSRDYILPFNIDYIQRWQTLADIKIVTIAPELSNSEAFIHYLKQHNMIPSIGHTHATFAETMTAIEQGCSYVTHLFNAMRGLHQREPGAVGAALLSNNVTVEMIVDGIHVHPSLVKLVLQLKGKDKLVLVTDAMRAKCLSDGKYELGGQSVLVKDQVARLSDGTLAGSTLKMPNALKNIMHYTDCDLMTAVKFASENPAKILKLFDSKGSIAIGKAADLVVMDEDLNVVLTIVDGSVCFGLD